MTKAINTAINSGDYDRVNTILAHVVTGLEKNISTKDAIGAVEAGLAPGNDGERVFRDPDTGESLKVKMVDTMPNNNRYLKIDNGPYTFLFNHAHKGCCCGRRIKRLNTWSVGPGALLYDALL